MELIPYGQFAKLRLKQFVGKDVDVDDLEGTEWMGGVWISESLGITGFRRLEATPKEMGGLEVIFEEISQEAALAILKTIQLPLTPRMTFNEVRSVLGAPEKTESPIAEWNNHEFTIGKDQPYYVSCSVDHTKGLIGLAVIRKDVLSKIEAEEAEENDR